MLKIVYRICCGMDVHKSFVVACIASTNEQGVTTYKSKRFSTFTGDLRRCAAWLAENNCKDVCMESTGKYWIPIYNILESSCNIVLAHPKYVKAIRGKKTDKRDAKWIADIFKHDLVAGSFIPPAEIRQLRDLVRYRWKLTNFTIGEKNRAQNCLTVSNFKLDDVFSDVFGKAASAIITRILENPAEKITDVSSFRTKRMKATDEEILAAVDGEMCAEQAEKLRIIRSRSGYVRVPHLEAPVLLGWSYAAEQRECREEENHQNQPGRSLHQAAACSVLSQCDPRQAIPRNSQPLPRAQKTSGPQESNYRHCKNAPNGYLQHAQEE